MSSLKNAVATAVGISVAGIQLWVDPPPRYRLRLRREREPERLAHMEAVLRRPPRLHPPFPDHPVRPVTTKLLFDRLDGPGRGMHSLVIDLDRIRISDDSSVFKGPRLGSGAMGVAIFSLPAVALLSPALLLMVAKYRRAEEREGMSRHGIALLKAIKGQLDRRTESLVVQALKNSWSHARLMSSTVTLEQAKALLAECDLLEENVTDADAKEIIPSDIGSRGFHWFDDEGDKIAQGSFYGQRDHFVRVRGSLFYDTEADELIQCFRSCIRRRCGSDDAGRAKEPAPGIPHPDH